MPAKKTREAELKSRKQPDEKVYEITLKLADQPGLPPPLEKGKSATLAGTFHQTGDPQPQVSIKLAPPVAGTNAETASAPVPADIGSALKTIDPDDPAAEEKAPPVDVDMREAEQILMDYISLLPGENTLTAQHTPLSQSVETGQVQQQR